MYIIIYILDHILVWVNYPFKEYVQCLINTAKKKKKTLKCNTMAKDVYFNGYVCSGSALRVKNWKTEDEFKHFRGYDSANFSAKASTR